VTEPAGLFDVEGLRVPSTPTARRRSREAEVIRVGFHPLTRGRLHPEADPASPSAPTCGTCRFRRPIERFTGAEKPKQYPKCWHDYPKRITHGPGSDVLASWPACVDYRPKGRD
jgi:hypothetical protein